MEKHDLIAEVLALQPGDQMEILKLLQARVGKDGANVEAGEGPAQGKRKADPWGSVYQELAKTFRRPAAR